VYRLTKIRKNRKKKQYKERPVYLKGHMVTKDVRAETVWIEEKPHERKFKSNILYIKCTREGDFIEKNPVQRIFKRKRTDRMEGKRDTSKIYVCVYIVSF
jgi:phage terminase large subunit